MNANSYSYLFNKAQELKKLVDSHKETKPLSDLISNVKRTHQLTSLSMMYKNLIDYKPEIKDVMDPPTSGFSSDCFEEDDKTTRTSCLSYTEVKNLLIDTSIIWKLGPDIPNEDPKELLMMVRNVKTSADYFKFKEMLEKQKLLGEVKKLKFIFYEGDYSILIHMRDTSRVSTHFNSSNLFQKNGLVYSLTARQSQFIDQLGDKFIVEWIKLNYGTDTSKKFNPKDPNCFFKTGFVAVIIRNLPVDTEVKTIEEYIRQRLQVAVRVEQICYLKREYFTLAILDSLVSSLTHSRV